MGRQGSANAIARRPHFSRVLQYQARDVLRGAAAVRGRLLPAGRPDREVHSAACRPKRIAPRRGLAGGDGAGQGIDHHPSPVEPQFGPQLRLFRPRHGHLQGLQRAPLAQSHDDIGADGRRVGRPAADLSSRHIVGILGRHRCAGPAGRNHQRPAIRSIHPGADSRATGHGGHRLRGPGERSQQVRRVLHRRRPDGSHEARAHADGQRALSGRLSAPHRKAQRRWRAGFNLAGYGGADPKPASRRPDPAQARDDCADDDQPAGRRSVDALSHDGRTSRQGIRARRRTDPAALAARSSGRGR
jgi:hypothetical protein